MPKTDRDHRPRFHLTTCQACNHPTTAGHTHCDICRVFGPLDRSGSPQERDHHRRATPSEPDHQPTPTSNRDSLPALVAAYLLLLGTSVGAGLHILGLVTW